MATTPRPYRRILTSALHRRFVHASAFALLVDYIVALAIGKKSPFFWLWFPFGASGLRTLLLFISSLSIFVLRVSQMHIGPRTSLPVDIFRRLFPLHAAQTLCWYLFSAWWFSEVYVWSATSNSDLVWVKPGRYSERAILNERPIYLHYYHLLLAFIQTVIHLYSDYDRIYIPVAKRTPGSPDQRIHPIGSVWTMIQCATPRAATDAFSRSVLMSAAAPFLYLLILRRPAWSSTLYLVKLFWDFPRAAADPPGRFLSAHFFLFIRSAVSGGLLILLWETANFLFSAFIAKEPLKRGQPLTTQAKDPNGSLLNGLKARKEVVKTFAFWELWFISQRFPERRKAIFSDIDRNGGPAWTQILNTSTKIIGGIATRINTYKNPPFAGTDSTEARPPIQTLPHLATPPKKENIFAPLSKPNSRQEKLEEAIRATAMAYGQAPDWTPMARATARGVLSRASTAVLSTQGKQKLLDASQELKLLTAPAKDPSSGTTLFPIVARFLRSRVGQPFRQTYERRLQNIVLGSPFGEICSVVDAIESLSQLFIASLAEDPFGKVQADLPAVVHLFTKTIFALEGFINDGLDIHWTDVYYPPSTNPEARSQARHIPDVDIVLDTLKRSLGALLTAFKPYFDDIGLVGKDLRLAREAAGVVEDQP